MSRNTEYQFFSTDTDTLVAELVAQYEKIVGVSVQPASPEKLFILWVAAAIIQERVQSNYAANQNIPSRAEGENLDALAELFFAQARPAAKPAVCTVRFWISEAQDTAILVPAGTRVTDASKALTWATTADVYIPAGETHIDIRVECQTAGVVGNGYVPGQLDTIIDLYDYCDHVENITESDDGTDRATDEEFYDLLRASMDGYSCAGSKGSYIYWAKRVSTEIGDVVPNSPAPGKVVIYVLMTDGTIAGEEMKAAVLASCSAEAVRPMTDEVSVADPEEVSYDIEITYYIPSDSTSGSADIEEAVASAVNSYIAWQSGKLGRDINPDKLREYLSITGVKRIELVSPTFTVLVDGQKNGEVPQVARVGSVSLKNGGFEDE